MDDIKFMGLFVMIAIVIFIIFRCYFIKKEKEEKEFEEYKEKLYKKYEIEKARIRKEKSIEWNSKIQNGFSEKVKYKTNRPIKILVGDYTTSMAPITNSALKIMGIETEVVPTASDVIERIESGNKYDAIITNNVYPNGESGYMVLSKLKEENNYNIPIVILTVDQNARKKYLEQGFDEYISKPLDEEKIKKYLKNVIGNLEFKEL